MTGFFVSVIAYIPALWLGKKLLAHYDIDFPGGPTRWIVLNTFAILVSYLAAIPF